MAKTKALISFAVTAKLICAFVFVYGDCWFSHAAAQITLSLHTTLPRTLYNMVHYNTILDITQVIAEPQMVILDYFSYISIDTFYSRYNMNWIVNKEIGLDPNKSVVKSLRWHNNYNLFVLFI